MNPLFLPPTRAAKSCSLNTDRSRNPEVRACHPKGNLVLVYKCGQEKPNNYTIKWKNKGDERHGQKSYILEFKQQAVGLYNAGGTPYPQL